MNFLNEKQRKFLEWCLVNQECTYIDSRYIERERTLAPVHRKLIHEVLDSRVYGESDRRSLETIAKYYKEMYELRIKIK